MVRLSSIQQTWRRKGVKLGVKLLVVQVDCLTNVQLKGLFARFLSRDYKIEFQECKKKFHASFA